MDVVTDWDIYRQASLDFLRGLNPMLTPLYSAPPWLCLLIAPLAILPRWFGYVLGAFILLNVVIVIVKQLKGDVWTILLACTTPFVLHNILYGSVEWVPLLGMLMPPTWGLLWVSGKPQSGAGAVLFHVIQAARRKLSFTTLIPLGVAGGLSLILYHYPFSMRPPPPDVLANASYAIFPWGVPVGLALVAWAAKRGDAWLAYAASPLLVPFFTSHTLIGAFLVLAARSRRWAVLAWLVAWCYALATPGRV
jgi:hypothetical protein